MSEEERTSEMSEPEAVEEGTAAAPGEDVSLQVAPAGGDGDAAVSSDDRLLSALMWLSMVLIQLPLLSLVLLLIEPNKHNPFQRHHAVSSIIFWVLALLYEGLATVVFTILSVVSLGCLAICGWVIFFVPHVLALYYALKAFNGERVEIPFATDFARRQGWL